MIDPKPVTLSWPSRALHPNARVHWGVKNRAAQLAKTEAFYAGQVAGWRRGAVPTDRVLRLTFTFQPATARHRDDDGLVALMKYSRDGLALALGVDDGVFQTQPPVMMPLPPKGTKPKPLPTVVATLEWDA